MGFVNLATVNLSALISLLIAAGFDSTTSETTSGDLTELTFFDVLGALDSFGFLEADFSFLTTVESIFVLIDGFASTARLMYFAPGLGPRFLEESFAGELTSDVLTEAGLVLSIFANLTFEVLATRVFLVVAFLYFAPGLGPRFFGES